ncbi:MULTISPECIES: DinB family protein [unclassified Flavobacterium]|uniref:DinB family protein n=1 Tax=unclassified Flavobacterium TaxID=196869 RepID=UPI000C182F58|nr:MULTISPECIES: DinB family protein [unclassified Flavobacterium]PIF61247.1 putative damage-inducible protein DinB [Flavobacterium sp. 11]WKL45615.1 DinB family protein [Flavobacterium sp. ZE23DGlu08]
MKKYLIIAVLLLSNNIFAQVEVVSTFIEKWDNSKDYLVAVAEAMPEDKYDYKPAEREMSFREQLFHIQDNMNWLGTTHFSGEKYVKKEAVKGLSKAQMIQEIKASFDKAKAFVQKTNDIELSQKVDFFAGPKSKLQILNLMQDHVTHHRAQILVYLNLNGIQPPKYVGW